jgi:hypothetical protein
VIQQESASRAGLTGKPLYQSLCHFLETELADYLRLLMTLEEEMHKDNAVMPGDHDQNADQAVSPNPSSLVIQQVPTERSGMTFQKLAS